MRLLVEAIKRQPPARRSYRLVEGAFCAVAAGEALERAGSLAPKGLALEQLPVVEGWAVAQTEARHELAAVQPGGGDERLQAGRAHIMRRVTVCLRLGEVAIELVHIEAQPRIRPHSDCLTSDRETILA